LRGLLPLLPMGAPYRREPPDAAGTVDRTARPAVPGSGDEERTGVGP
jgi:hypothetical protein